MSATNVLREHAGGRVRAHPGSMGLIRTQLAIGGKNPAYSLSARTQTHFGLREEILLPQAAPSPAGAKMEKSDAQKLSRA